MKFKILRYTEVDSTQNQLKRLLINKKRNYVVVARRQRKGRGRYGRRWESPDGGLWFSFNVDFKMEREKFLIKVCSDLLMTLTGFVPYLNIKPPNDIVYEGKKVAGILIEVWRGYYITGIGVNVNNLEHPDRAISISEITGEKYDILKILKLFLHNFINNPVDTSFYVKNVLYS